MVSMIEDGVLDNGLSAGFKALASAIYITQTEPTTYALATGTGSTMCGYKSFGVGSAFTGPAAGATPTGRKVTSVATTDGTIVTAGTASWWAAVGTAALLAHGTLSSAQAVAASNTFSLGAFDVKVANQ